MWSALGLALLGSSGCGRADPRPTAGGSAHTGLDGPSPPAAPASASSPAPALSAGAVTSPFEEHARARKLDAAAAAKLVAPGAVVLEWLEAGAEPHPIAEYPSAPTPRSRLDLSATVMSEEAAPADGSPPKLEPAASRGAPPDAMRFAFELGLERTASGRLHVDVLQAALAGAAKASGARPEDAAVPRLLRGAAFELPYHPRGLDAAEATRGAELPIAAQQLAATVEEVVRAAVVPLPERPVGKGGRWRTLSQGRRGGVPHLRYAEYRCDAVAPLQVSVRVHERPLVGPSRDPLVPEGLALTVLGGLGEAEGTISLDAAGLPLRVELAFDGVVSLEVAGPPGTTPIASTVRTRQNLFLSRKP